MLKLLTAPVWVLPYAVGKAFRARAVVRSGRRVQPVRVVRTPVLVQRTPVVVRVHLVTVPQRHDVP